MDETRATANLTWDCGCTGRHRSSSRVTPDALCRHIDPRCDPRIRRSRTRPSHPRTGRRSEGQRSPSGETSQRPCGGRDHRQHHGGEARMHVQTQVLEGRRLQRRRLMRTTGMLSALGLLVVALIPMLPKAYAESCRQSYLVSFRLLEDSFLRSTAHSLLIYLRRVTACLMASLEFPDFLF